MIHISVSSCVGHTPLVELGRLFPSESLEVIAKLELLNPSGSVKARPARYIVEQGLLDGTFSQSTHLVESSSGNFGVAVAMLARVYGMQFTCVVDPHITPTNLKLLKGLGAHVEQVTEPDEHGGYLQTRIARVRQLVSRLPDAVWINQYANERNWQVHYHDTAGEILADLDRPVDALVVAVSTTGTLMGLARRLRCVFPRLRVIAVDAAGSVVFGGPPGPRKMPGLGASRVPELLRRDEIDDVVHVTDREAVEGCRRLAAAEGILAGGSSGAVVSAIAKLAPDLPAPYRVLTLFPDRGDRYLDLVYDDDWVDSLPETVAAAARPVDAT